jgi:hypothetical protein
MFSKAIPAAIATMLLVSTAGCYQAQQVKSADEVAAEQQAAKEAAKNQAMDLNRERFARAASAAKLLTQQVAQQDWEAAKDSLTLADQQVQGLLADANVPIEVKTQVAAVIPAINQARVAVNAQHSKTTAATQAPSQVTVAADQLNKQFNRTAETLVAMGWLTGTTGGGAGTGTTPNQVPIDQNHDEQ